MERFASVTFDGVLAASDRDVASRSLVPAEAHDTVSWLRPFELSVSFPGGGGPEPVLAVLCIALDDEPGALDLERSLAGAGRPLGVVDARRDERSVVVRFDPCVSALGTIVSVIEAVLGRDVGAAIAPDAGSGRARGALDDDALAATAGRLLGEPRLDAARLIETHLEPLLANDSL